MLISLLLWPLLCSVLAFVAFDKHRRPGLLPIAGTLQLALTLAALAASPEPELGGWLVLDPLGRLVLLVVNGLTFVAGLYAPAYLGQRPEHPNRTFVGSLLAFVAMANLICLAHHLGLLWVALEATTLASAPLVYFNRNPRSLEATWKYLLVGSVGVAVALMGSLFLAYAALEGGVATSLRFEDLIVHAPRLSKPWLHAAFVLLLVGYGTKLGLAPLHAWKPDAYGEAPGLVGMMLAGALTSAAFLALLRFYQICQAAGEGAFAREILGAVGLFSLAVAALFLARQRDYKRMVAWSSVEHVGLLALGIGIGGAGIAASLFHTINNALAKGLLFLAAANIHRAYGTKLIADTRGVLGRLPWSGGLFVAGFLAASGAPPFGSFWSELQLVNAAIAAGRPWLAGLVLGLLAIAFLGMGASVIAMVQGGAEGSSEAGSEGAGTVLPALLLFGLALWLGLDLPGPVARLLGEAAAFVEGPR